MSEGQGGGTRRWRAVRAWDADNDRPRRGGSRQGACYAQVPCCNIESVVSRWRGARPQGSGPRPLEVEEADASPSDPARHGPQEPACEPLPKRPRVISNDEPSKAGVTDKTQGASATGFGTVGFETVVENTGSHPPESAKFGQVSYRRRNVGWRPYRFAAAEKCKSYPVFHRPTSVLTILASRCSCYQPTSSRPALHRLPDPVVRSRLPPFEGSGYKLT